MITRPIFVAPRRMPRRAGRLVATLISALAGAPMSWLLKLTANDQLHDEFEVGRPILLACLLWRQP
ncbi:hypothetical protein X741_21665 [Mesorhizobium sp. LNHC229A00]|nr:hypothetical protein X741_21665 [Mesorhizobium sp. LNHC229A00]